MDELLEAVTAALDAVRAVVGWRDAVALSPGELMAANDALGALQRSVDAARLPVVAEVARQSRAELGRDGLARRAGYRSAATFISATTGASVGEAIRLMAVGEATAPRMTLTGESMPARHPFVAEAVRAGRIGMPAASAITTMLDRVVLRAERGAWDEMERRLSESAAGLTLDQLQKLIVRAEALLDPDGIEPREDELRGQRSFTIRQDRSGAIVFTGRADPESGAPILAAVEGIVSGMLRRKDAAEKSGDPLPDRRSVAQMRADALADLCRHALGCTEIPTRPSTTVVVRMTLAELEAGVGTATIDGVDQPVSAGAVRRMASDAEIIPCVLGGKSEVLDWGRAKRLFTRPQKLALAERDGGCAACGLPPQLTVGHHIRWWDRHRGRTDLRNGILLCTSCHHRIHDDGWEIRIDGDETEANVWFIPPPWLDAARTPRPGGRARYDLVA